MFFYIILGLSLCSTLAALDEVMMGIDIGTGKIKMQVAEVRSKLLEVEPLLCKSVAITSDSRGTLTDFDPIFGMISEEIRAAICSHLMALKKEAEHFQPTKCQAIATELFRRAINGKETAQYLEQVTGIPIRIISQEEESLLGFLSAIHEAHLDPQKTVIWDIGSGSFQITCKEQTSYVTFNAPYGRGPMLKLMQRGALDELDAALRKADQRILDKIESQGATVVGIGAHPKQVLKEKKRYTLQDIKDALGNVTELNMEFAELSLVQKVMEQLSIAEIEYIGVRAGNTTALFLHRGG